MCNNIYYLCKQPVDGVQKKTDYCCAIVFNFILLLSKFFFKYNKTIEKNHNGKKTTVCNIQLNVGKSISMLIENVL